jgi:hypothetical protein
MSQALLQVHPLRQDALQCHIAITAVDQHLTAEENKCGYILPTQSTSCQPAPPVLGSPPTPRPWRLSIVNAVIMPLFALTKPVSAFPIIKRAAESTNSNATSIVSNFQDLSAILSLLAADTVEDKLCDPSSNDLERVSTTWCLFGILGVVRAFSKIAVGLAGAEAAGIQLSGSGVYTSKRTKSALSRWVVGMANPTPLWQDDKNRILGEVDAIGAPWIRPHIVVMGYSRCLFRTRARRVIFDRALCVLLTGVITAVPVIILRTGQGNNLLNNMALGVLVGSTLMCCGLSPVIQARNDVGVNHLRDVSVEERFKDVLALRTGDTVITTKGQHPSAMILWQEDLVAVRSADRVDIRIMSAAAALALLAGYVINYLVLGSANSPRAYVWLGVQVAILFLRYCLWATKPQLLHQREQCVLYFTAGSLVDPIDPDHPDKDLGATLSRDVVHFAVASAGSKVLNDGGHVLNLNIDVLNLLSDSAPRDILLANYCNLDQLLNSEKERVIRAIRLPWSFMEELYAAQGLILGKNPWALGGLYLSAVFDISPIGTHTFLGLTTVHPRRNKTNEALSQDGLSPGAPPNVVGFTYECYGITGSLVDGTVSMKAGGVNGYADWHTKFRENVATCRSSAVSNGPGHCEVHVRYLGEESRKGSRMTRVDPSMKDVLTSARDIVNHEKEKDHSVCQNDCKIFGFSNM